MPIRDIFVTRRVGLSNHSGINALAWYKCDTDQSSFTILHTFKRHQGGGAGKLESVSVANAYTVCRRDAVLMYSLGTLPSY